MDELVLAQARGYLEADATQSGVGDLVRAWRLSCRQRRQQSLVVLRSGEQASIHLRLAPGQRLTPIGNFLLRRKLLRNSYISHRCDATSISLQQVPSERLTTLLEQLRELVAADLSPEQQALVLGFPDRPSLEDHLRTLCPWDAGDHGSVPRRASAPAPGWLPPPIPMLLDPSEYAAMGCALSRLFSYLPAPLVVFHLAEASEGDWLLPLESVLPQRLPGLKAETIQSWQDRRGPYLLEDRFGLPGGVALIDLATRTGYQNEWDQLRGDFPRCPAIISVSRPGFDPARQQALLYACADVDLQLLSHANARESSERFAGFVMLQRDPLGWTVVASSHDEDWAPLDFERKSERRSQPRPLRVPAEWKLVCSELPESAQAPEPPQAPFVQEQWEQNERLYSRLIGGELDSPPIVGTLHGPHLTLQELVRQAEDRGELLWSDRACPVTHALHEHGIAVVRWDRSRLWLGKALAHLSERFPCVDATLAWGVYQQVPLEGEDERALEALGRVLVRAGLPGRQVIGADFRHCRVGPTAWLVQTEDLPLACQSTRPSLLQSQPGARWQIRTQPGALVRLLGRPNLVQALTCQPGYTPLPSPLEGGKPGSLLVEMENRKRHGCSLYLLVSTLIAVAPEWKERLQQAYREEEGS